MLLLGYYNAFIYHSIPLLLYIVLLLNLIQPCPCLRTSIPPIHTRRHACSRTSARTPTRHQPHEYSIGSNQHENDARRRSILISSSSSLSSNNNDDIDNNTNTTITTNISKREMAIMEAQELRNKARALMEEAQREEAILRSKKERRRLEIQGKLDSYIFTLLEAAQEQPSQEDEDEDEEEDPVLTTIRDNRKILTTEIMVQIMDRLFYERDFFHDASIRNTTTSFRFGIPSSDYADRIHELLDRILQAYDVLDKEEEEEEEYNHRQKQQNKKKREPIAPMLRSRIKELLRLQEEDFKRKIHVELHKFHSNDASSKEQQQQISPTSISSINITKEDTQQRLLKARMKEYLFLPHWVPNTLDKYIINCNTDLSKADAWQIKSEVLLHSLFCCTSSSTIRTAAIYRGNFLPLPPTPSSSLLPSFPKKRWWKSKEDTFKTNTNTTSSLLSQIVFQDIQQRLQSAKGGLSDRVQLFLMYDPEWRRRGQSSSSRPEMDTPKPVILAIPKSVVPTEKNQGERNPVLNSLSVFLTVVLSFRYSVSAYALNLKIFQPVLYEGDLSILLRAIPITLGVLMLQGMHEIAHRVTATNYNVTLGPPLPLVPFVPLGCCSAITPLRSFPASRAHLMDIASSGPLTGLLLSVVCLIAGIRLSTSTQRSVLEVMPVVSVDFFRRSFFVGSIASVLAPRLMLLPLAQPVPVHPLVMVGYSGLFASALNLLPIGRLDGGRMFMAAFGRRKAKLITNILMGLIWPAALLILPTGISRQFSFWNFIVILLQCGLDVQLRDEVTEIDAFRRKSYIGLLLLVFTILVPFPRTLRR